MTNTDTTLADRHADTLDRLPADRREEFLRLLGTGKSPKVIAAAIDYDANRSEYTQKEIAERWNVGWYGSVGKAWREHVRGDG